MILLPLWVELVIGKNFADDWCYTHCIWGQGGWRPVMTCFCATLARLFLRNGKYTRSPKIYISEVCLSAPLDFFYLVHHLFFQNVTFTSSLEFRQNNKNTQPYILPELACPPSLCSCELIMQKIHHTICHMMNISNRLYNISYNKSYNSKLRSGTFPRVGALCARVNLCLH